ncbi:MAG: hypothetical protein A2252_06010 [Elusimicrobia bacterium RIFOXYA2_FULL_39_19]|nr:MAG: hypothetical protein A2252_06010 [Elusimicrobia bacterium RIFOXYA2_FULL_39_19]
MSKKLIICLFSVLLILTLFIYKSEMTYSESFTQKGGLFLFPNSFIGLALFDSEETYDARDQYNQPIQTAQANKNLKQLFIDSIYALLSSAEAYTTVKSLQILKAKFNLLNSYFTTAHNYFVQQILGIQITMLLKKLIVCLSQAFLSALIIATSLVSLPFLFYTPKAKVAPLVLRC